MEDTLIKEKRFYKRETTSFVRSSPWAKILSTLSWLAENLELNEGLIIWVALKGRGVWKTFGELHNSMRQLFNYFKICFDQGYLILLILPSSFFHLKTHITSSSRLIAPVSTLYKHSEIQQQRIILFKLLRKSKRSNKENFTSKSNSNKIMLCRGGGQLNVENKKK